MTARGRRPDPEVRGRMSLSPSLRRLVSLSLARYLKSPIGRLPGPDAAGGVPHPPPHTHTHTPPPVGPPSPIILPSEATSAAPLPHNRRPRRRGVTSSSQLNPSNQQMTLLSMCSRPRSKMRAPAGTLMIYLFPANSESSPRRLGEVSVLLADPSSPFRLVPLLMNSLFSNSAAL